VNLIFLKIWFGNNCLILQIVLRGTFIFHIFLSVRFFLIIFGVSYFCRIFRGFKPVKLAFPPGQEREGVTNRGGETNRGWPKLRGKSVTVFSLFSNHITKGGAAMANAEQRKRKWSQVNVCTPAGICRSFALPISFSSAILAPLSPHLCVGALA